MKRSPTRLTVAAVVSCFMVAVGKGEDLMVGHFGRASGRLMRYGYTLQRDAFIQIGVTGALMIPGVVGEGILRIIYSEGESFGSRSGPSFAGSKDIWSSTGLMGPRAGTKCADQRQHEWRGSLSKGTPSSGDGGEGRERSVLHAPSWSTA